MNIVVDHVTKTIHRAVVLQDISLNFESGKVYGLQGENGSGKTMLLAHGHHDEIAAAALADACHKNGLSFICSRYS